MWAIVRKKFKDIRLKQYLLSTGEVPLIMGRILGFKQIKWNWSEHARKHPDGNSKLSQKKNKK